MRHRFANFEYSLRRLWYLLLAFLLISVIFFFFVLDYQQKTDLLRSTAESQFNSVTIFSEQMSQGLSQAEDYLYSSFYGNENIYTIANASDEVTQYKAKQELSDDLDRIVQLNEFVEAAWFFQAEKHTTVDSDIFLSRNNYTGITIQEITKMRALITEDLQDPTSSMLLSNSGWSLFSLDDRYYLLWVTPVDQAYCGAWVSISHLYTLLQSQTLLSEDEQDDICDLFGNSLLFEKSFDSTDFSTEGSFLFWDRKNIQIGMQPENTNLVLRKNIPSQNILRTVKSARSDTIILLLFIAIVALIVLLYQFLISRPFVQMLENMEKIRQKNSVKSGSRLPVRGHFSDVKILSSSINQLLDTNQELNQKIFDAQIRERDVQVQYLQIRLKAHFYMNGLSLIHAMARMNQTDLIQELSQCLIEYLRFIDVDTQKFVRLRDELDHVRSYARIQELRFPGLFQYTEDVSAELYDASIPPLVLQTFVENSIEHGMRQGENYEILIRAHYLERDHMPGMYFTILDNGIGFSPEQLQEFSKTKHEILLNQNHGIGIKNVINRLRLLYDGKAEIIFENRTESGASISLWLPLLDLWEEETDEL